MPVSVSFWKILSMAGALAEEFTKVGADGVIDPVEALEIASVVAKQIGIPISIEGNPVDPDVFINVVRDILGLVKDKKISMEAVCKVVAVACQVAGIELVD